MTPEKKTGASFTMELSPALYNRFSIFHMEDLSFEKKSDFLTEIEMIATVGLETSNREDLKLVRDLCWLLVEEHKHHRSLFASLTLRNFVRLIDSTYLLLGEFPALSFSSSLYTAFIVTIISQIKESFQDLKDQLLKKVHSLFGSLPRVVPDFLSGKPESPEHVLSESRKQHAQAVLSCIACRIPVLLEVDCNLFSLLISRDLLP